MNPAIELALVCTLLIMTAAFVTRRSTLKVQVVTLALATLLCVPIAEKWASDVRAERLALQLDRYRPADLTQSPSSPYAGSRACKACHPQEYATWASSFHRTMTQEVTPKTVLADFDDVELDYQGRTYRAFRDGDRFMIDVPKIGTTGEEPDERVVRQVVMSTGSHHQQLYWYPRPEADAPPDSEAEDIYHERCAACHEDGDGPPLSAQELHVDTVRAALKNKEHNKKIQPPLSAEEAARMVPFVERMQIIDRLMQFPFSWLIDDQRWVHEDLTFLGPPDEVLDIEPYDQGWSNACDACHAVAARFEAPFAGHLGEASVVELGISCEVCHGPAQNHVLTHMNPLARYEAHNGKVPDDIVNPVRLSPRRSAAVCGQCHAETADNDARPPNRFKPGMRLEDYIHPVQRHDPPHPKWLERALLAEEDLLDSGFWGDGTVRIAGRDYNGLMRTGCHTEGELTCTTCHVMHGDDPNDQLRPEAKTNEVCERCHQSIAKDVSAHTHHPPESAGSLCYNCHMPKTTWGLLGAMRAHRVTSPNAATTAATGRPSACNLCHLDRSFASVRDTLVDWYDQAPPTGPETAKRTMPDDLSAAVVWLLRGDGVQRAVVAWHFGWEPARQTTDPWWAPGVLARGLNDPYAAVRYTAYRSLKRYPGFTEFAFDFGAEADELYEKRVEALKNWSPPAGKSEPRAGILQGGIVDHGRLLGLEITKDQRPVAVNE